MAQTKRLILLLISCLGLIPQTQVASAASVSTGPNTNASIGVSHGGLNLTAPNIDHPFHVSSASQTSAFANLSPMVVTDATGTGAGWNVTVQASEVSLVSPDAQLGAYHLPYDSLQLMAPQAFSDNPLADGRGPSIVEDGMYIDIPNGSLTVARSARNDGMGTWVFNFPRDCLKLNLGSAAQNMVHDLHAPATFSTTLTWRVSCGP